MIVFVVNPDRTNTVVNHLKKLPPSAKFVYKILESHGQLTQKDLIRETSLPSRTVRYALNRLKKEKFLIEHQYLTDARQSLYKVQKGEDEN